MSQTHDIVYHLHNIGSITPLEALEKYGCFRLGARINDLRREGYNILTTMIEHNNKRFAKYSLEEGNVRLAQQ